MTVRRRKENMNELSLFTGAGGGLLGTLLLGWRPVGFVESNEYRQMVIAARIRDKILPDAPIFGNIESFIRDGYAASYTGVVDVVTAGFPCQPFAAGGKHRGRDDDRNKWPETISVIRIVRPTWVLLENSPRLLARHGDREPYFGTIVRDLHESGYVGRWGVLSAASLGYPHRRDRLWVIAYSGKIGRTWFLRHRIRGVVAPLEIEKRTRKPANALESICSYLEAYETSQGEPAIFGGTDGIPFGVDRLEAIGDGQVPAVVKKVFEIIFCNKIRLTPVGVDAASPGAADENALPAAQLNIGR